MIYEIDRDAERREILKLINQLHNYTNDNQADLIQVTVHNKRGSVLLETSVDFKFRQHNDPDFVHTHFQLPLYSKKMKDVSILIKEIFRELKMKPVLKTEFVINPYFEEETLLYYEGEEYFSGDIVPFDEEGEQMIFVSEWNARTDNIYFWFYDENDFDFSPAFKSVPLSKLPHLKIKRELVDIISY